MKFQQKVEMNENFDLFFFFFYFLFSKDNTGNEKKNEGTFTIVNEA